jgi:hypothetical protein
MLILLTDETSQIIRLSTALDAKDTLTFSKSASAMFLTAIGEYSDTEVVVQSNVEFLKTKHERVIWLASIQIEETVVPSRFPLLNVHDLTEQFNELKLFSYIKQPTVPDFSVPILQF